MCVPLYGAHDHFVRCIRSLLDHTPVDVPILIADDATPEPASRRFVDALAAGPLRHEIVWMSAAQNRGFVGNVNAAFDAIAPADVVIVNSDVIVAAGWLEGLRSAARSDSTVATATAMTNCGTIVSVPHRNRQISDLPQDVSLDQAAKALRGRSQRIRPRIPVAIGHCLYVRREALDLVGGFDELFAPGYGEEVDHSQRMLAAGLQHVVADDVLVTHHGGGSFDSLGGRTELQRDHERLIRERYPYYSEVIEHASEDPSSPLSRAIATASWSVRGLRVTIDGRCLGPILTGTQLHVLEVAAAVARTGRAKVRLVLPPAPGGYVSQALAGLPVELTDADVAAECEPDDVVHRPWQVSEIGDFRLLTKLGLRQVITQQDLIAYRNPSYFPSAERWHEYRGLATEALSLASIVLFFSAHARADALSEDLVPDHRARVVLLGTDHTLSAHAPSPSAPTVELADLPFLVCLGTDFRHKNRVFALRLLAQLHERHGWEGRLVLAGPRVERGSSAADEAALLAADPALAARVVELPAVSEAEKSWLLSRCAAVVYPTTYEGFGLVPFEAADHGRPCLFARQASLEELFGAEDAMLVPWDAAASADRAIEVLRDDEHARRLVERVRARGRTLSWSDAGEALVDAYEDAVRMPVRSTVRRAGPAMTVDARYWALVNQIGSTGMSLVAGEDKPLLPEREQRALAALVRRPLTRVIVLGALRALGRLGGGVRPPGPRLESGEPR